MFVCVEVKATSHLAQLVSVSDPSWGHYSIPLIIDRAELSLTKGRDKQSNSSLRLPGTLATKTTKVLVQHVAAPKPNLVDLLDVTLVNTETCSTLFVQQRAGIIINTDPRHDCNAVILTSHWSYIAQKQVMGRRSGWDTIHPVIKHCKMILKLLFSGKKLHNVLQWIDHQRETRITW